MKKSPFATILVIQVCLTFGHSGAIFGASQCENVFSQAWTGIVERTALSAEQFSTSFWAQLESRIDKTFSDNFRADSQARFDVFTPPYERLLKTGDAHLNTLKKLGLLTVDGKLAPASRILSEISRAIITSAREAKVDGNGVLKPTFVFELPDGRKVWRAWGEAVPDEAKLYIGVLPGGSYSQMLAEGFFPVGGSEAAAPTSTLSLFEHDIAHLTSFIENPLYMQAIRDGARKAHAGVGRTKSSSRSRQELSYFINEGLVLIDPKLHDRLSQLLQTGPLAPPLSQINLVQNINALSRTQLEELFRFTSTEMALYVRRIGGASRDPVNRLSNPAHSLVESALQPELTDLSMKVRDMGENLDTQEVQKLARVLKILDKLSQITIADWLPVIGTLSIDPNSKIGDALSKKLWNDLPYPFLSLDIGRPIIPELVDALEMVPRDNSDLPYPELLAKFHEFQIAINGVFKTNEPMHDFLWDFSQVFSKVKVSLILQSLSKDQKNLNAKLQALTQARAAVLGLVSRMPEDAPPPPVLKASFHYLINLVSTANSQELSSILSGLQDGGRLNSHPSLLVDALDRVQKRENLRLFNPDELKKVK